jgi:hypothetical protein
MQTPLEFQYEDIDEQYEAFVGKGKFLLIYIFNFHVLSNLLLIYICKLHWNKCLRRQRIAKA